MERVKVRDSIPEMFRILLMWMIVFWHLVLYGVPSYSSKPILLILTTLMHVAVPCFVFISGWYGIRPSIRGFMRLVVMVVFYSFLGYIFRLGFGQEGFSLRSLCSVLSPLFHNRWWFIGVYLALYLTVPILEGFIRSTDSRHVWKIIGVLYCISFWLGANSLWVSRLPIFWMLYLLGRVLHEHECRQLKSHLFRIYGGCVIAIIVAGMISSFGGHTLMILYHMAFFNYTAPFLLLSSVALSLMFLRSRRTVWRSPLINSMAAAVFPCYLMHEKNFIPLDIYNRFGNLCHGAISVVLLGILASIFILIACIVVDLIFRPIYSKIGEYIAERVCKVVAKMNP